MWLCHYRAWLVDSRLGFDGVWMGQGRWGHQDWLINVEVKRVEEVIFPDVVGDQTYADSGLEQVTGRDLGREWRRIVLNRFFVGVGYLKLIISAKVLKKLSGVS